MAHTMKAGETPWYYLPSPSGWPIVGSLGLGLLTFGAASWFNGAAVGPWVVLAGFLVMFYMMFGWFGRVIGESEGHRYSMQVDRSFRWAMGWFIFSEVMFFAAFFGALFYARLMSVPGLGEIEQKLLWPNFQSMWPTAGPAARAPCNGTLFSRDLSCPIGGRRRPCGRGDPATERGPWRESHCLR